jgi:uncharacterized damage-inducible protein DinB
VPAAVDAYIEWCRGHGLHISGLSGPMVVSEVVRCWRYEDDYEVNAFFASDRPPLMGEELAEFEYLLDATRQDLLAAVEGLGEDGLRTELPGERWPIHGVLKHVADAEWWYLDRLGVAFGRADLPADPFELLEVVRGQTKAALSELAKRTGVVTLAGETWSARKVLRRALWHERDHTEHIRNMRAKLG